MALGRTRSTHPLVKQIGPLLHERFVLGDVLREGLGSAIVACEDRMTGRRLVAKVFASIDRLSALEQLAAEANIGRVNHPNVCSAIDGGEQHAVPFVILEHLEGETLATCIARSGPLAIPFAVDIFMQLLSALDAIHSAGIIHRDVKPSNTFLVHREGCPPVVKIIDFGVSRRRVCQFDAQNQNQNQNQNRSTRASTKQTKSGAMSSRPMKSVSGTFAYMSPEHARGELPSERSDLYSVGISLFEALAGRRPYTRSYDTTLRRSFDIQAPDVRTLRRDVPPSLAEIVQRATALSPTHRFASANAMMRALKTLQLATTKEWEIPTTARSRHDDDDDDLIAAHERPTRALRICTRGATEIAKPPSSRDVSPSSRC